MGASFENLEVWKKSCRLSVRLYELLKSCRTIKHRRGNRKKSILDFKRFINIAQGSAAELRTQVYISRQINIFSYKEAEELINELKSISKMLQALHNSLKKPSTVNR